MSTVVTIDCIAIASKLIFILSTCLPKAIIHIHFNAFNLLMYYIDGPPGTARYTLIGRQFLDMFRRAMGA